MVNFFPPPPPPAQQKENYHPWSQESRKSLVPHWVYGAGIYSNITQEDKSLGVLTLMAREFSRNKADNPSSTVKPVKNGIHFGLYF
jgi:hypothetical protein